MSIDLIGYTPNEDKDQHNCPICGWPLEISSESASFWGDFYIYTCHDCGLLYEEMTERWKDMGE